MKKTIRGFGVFAATDRVKVIESSLAFEGPHVRVFGGRDESDAVHLSLQDAETVRDGLALFIAKARAGELTEKP